MNTNKVQRELFNAFIGRGLRPAIVKCGEDTIYTATGYNGYIMREPDIVFDLTKFRQVNGKEIEPKDEKDVLIKATKAAYLDKGKIMQRYEAEGFSIYLNPSYLKCFDNPQLYARSPLDRVLVYEQNTFVGVVLPIRTEYGDLFETVLQETAKLMNAI